MYADAQLRSRALEEVATLLGPWDLETLERPFDFSDYYTPEMGDGLHKQLLAFKTLRDPGDLAHLKQACNRLEARFAVSGRRRINLDPGLVTPGGVMLATTKPAGHRIPLRDGIFAELTLYFHRGGFVPLPWTYPDFCQEDYRGFLATVRRHLLRQLADHP